MEPSPKWAGSILQVIFKTPCALFARGGAWNAVMFVDKLVLLFKSSFVHGQVLLSIVNFVCIGQVFVCQLGLVM